MFDLIDPDIEEYCEAHTSPESDMMHRLYRETNLNVMNPRMLSGHLQGSFLTMISRMLRPRHILEIGTYTGYSALCLAEGLTPDGRLDTIEINEELEDMILKYFQQSPKRNQINLIIGNALQLIPSIDVSYDLVFLDAEKQDYLAYYQMILPKIRQGGILLVDNVLWNEKVVREVKEKDKDTKAIMEFNDFVQKDPAVKNMMLPFRDGILLIEKL